MLSSISPLGERARANRWWVTTTAYLIGSLIGGIALGLLAGTLGLAIPDRWHAAALVVGGVALLVGLVLDVRLGARGSVPSWQRQVDEAWIGRYRGWVYGGGFGVQLGFGHVTIVTSTTTYAVVLLAALTGSPGLGAVVGGVFGLTRALPSLLLRRVDDRDRLRAALRRLQRMATSADILAKVALTVAAAVLLVAGSRAG